MARSSGGSGPIAWAPGNQNCDYAVLFDETSTSITSHEFAVDNNFVRIAAFNLTAGEVITIEQITGLGAGSLIADYAPVSGPVRLYYNSVTDQRTSYVLERPGRYRAKLTTGSLGLIQVFAVKYYVENEASQDVADALYAVINKLTTITPCTIGAMIPRNQTAVNNVVGVNNSNCLIDFPLVSGAGGNAITLRPDGVYSAGGSSPTACTLGATIPDAVTAPNNYVGKDNVGCLEDAQLVSSGAGNLLQLRDDGVFYGTTPPPNFVNQYVSSSTGNDSNAGTIGSPLRTIAKAISNLPDGTRGFIFLLAGDVFHTYPTATTDVINTLTYKQSFDFIDNNLDIGDRQITLLPYNDTAIDAISAYNIAHGTGYNPFIAAETNFPVIKVTLSLPTDIPASYIALGFRIGANGVFSTLACNFTVGQTGTVSPSVIYGGIIGRGVLSLEGGKITIGSVGVIAEPQGGQQSVLLLNLQVADHGTPSTPPQFARINGGTQFFVNSIGDIAPGGLIVPALTYTNIGSNVRAYLASAALWQGLIVYSTAFRSFSSVITAIPIA